MEKSTEPLTTEELTDVAPMLPPKDLTEEVRKTSEKEQLNLKAIVGLAPFLDDVVSKLEDDNFEGVTALAPFLSEKSLNSIVDKALEKGDVSELTGIACFLGRKTLKKISEFLLKTDDTKSMSMFARFM